MKFLILTLVMSLGAAERKVDTSKTGYIFIYYPGDVSKPYPEIVFYHSVNVDSIFENDPLVQKIEVSENELTSLESLIDKSKTAYTTDTMHALVGIHAVINKNEHGRFLKKEMLIKDLFAQIIQQLTNAIHQELAIKALNSLLVRLGIPRL